MNYVLAAIAIVCAGDVSPAGRSCLSYSHAAAPVHSAVVVALLQYLYVWLCFAVTFDLQR